MVTIHCKFIITVKKNGKICHSYASNNYVYRRKEVKESGVAYFTCNVDAKYSDKEASNTEEEPTIML